MSTLVIRVFMCGYSFAFSSEEPVGPFGLASIVQQRSDLSHIEKSDYHNSSIVCSLRLACFQPQSLTHQTSSTTS